MKDFNGVHKHKRDKNKSPLKIHWRAFSRTFNHIALISASNLLQIFNKCQNSPWQIRKFLHDVDLGKLLKAPENVCEWTLRWVLFRQTKKIKKEITRIFSESSQRWSQDGSKEEFWLNVNWALVWFMPYLILREEISNNLLDTAAHLKLIDTWCLE